MFHTLLGEPNERERWMDDQNWLKYGAVGLVAIGFLAILGFALTRGGDLEGHLWSVGQSTIDGAMTAPIEGTELTATFDGGTVSGTAGCNDFNASYGVDGDSLTIGPAASTLKFCEQPDGTMDQEIAYLTLLQSADRFDVGGDTLTLFVGGTPAITYTKAKTE